MAARRAVQAKAAALATGAENLRLAPQTNASGAGGNRLKSTSMTNLVSPHFSARPIQRPASRNALDSIHKGMNAKFTHVQSKVLLQNIRPAGDAKAASSKIPPAGGTLRATARGRGQTLTPTLAGGAGGRPAGSQQSERSQLINRVKALQEELASGELAREELKLELERERADKLEQVGQLKGELEAKAAAGERHNEDYHQKLLEAYELADQNRRAADSVLSESRQREEELRKRIEELEQQLGELREFVAVKEEMMSKMGELREQMRTERERYEEQTRTLNQLFASEKIRLEMELMDKVKQVSESYELNKLKTLNRTVELDARLATERLLATKMRLHQLNGDNERLGKQLRAAQTQLREQEKKLLLAETMLRQFVGSATAAAAAASKAPAVSSSTAARLRASTSKHSRLVRFGRARAERKASLLAASAVAAGIGRPHSRGGQSSDDELRPLHPSSEERRQLGELGAAGSGAAAYKLQASRLLRSTTSPNLRAATASSTAGTQTQQPSRARAIISDLRKRLNLGGGGAVKVAAADSAQADVSPGKLDAASQAGASLEEAAANGLHPAAAAAEVGAYRGERDEDLLLLGDGRDTGRARRRRRSISLDAFLNDSIVRELDGERLIISRGWPPSIMRAGQGGQRRRRAGEHHERRHHHQRAHRSRSERRPSAGTKTTTIVRSGPEGRRRASVVVTNGRAATMGGELRAPGAISELHKRRLLIEFLEQQQRAGKLGGERLDVEPSAAAAAPVEVKLEFQPATTAGGAKRAAPSARAAPTTIHYELPVHPARVPIALGGGGGGGR